MEKWGYTGLEFKLGYLYIYICMYVICIYACSIRKCHYCCVSSYCYFSLLITIPNLLLLFFLIAVIAVGVLFTINIFTINYCFSEN